MRLFPVLLLLIELTCLNANAIPNANEFYNVLEKKCPSIKNVTLFAQQDLFKNCVDWKVIEETKNLTKDTERNIRCLLYFDSFVSFCAELSTQNVQSIGLKFLIPELKDYTVNKICKDLTLFPVNRKFDHDILKTIINEEHCVKLCDSYTDTPVRECSLAHYFANFNVTQLKTESLLKEVQQEKKETVNANQGGSAVAAQEPAKLTSLVKPGVNPPGVNPPGVNPSGVNPPGVDPPGGNPPWGNPPVVNPLGGNPPLINSPVVNPGLQETNSKDSQTNAKTGEVQAHKGETENTQTGVNQSSGGNEPVGADNLAEAGTLAKANSLEETSKSEQASKPVVGSNPPENPPKTDEDHHTSQGNKDDTPKEQSQKNPKESLAKGPGISEKPAEVKHDPSSNTNEQPPPDIPESQAVNPPKNVASEPVNTEKHSEEGEGDVKGENVGQENIEGLKGETDYEGIDQDDEPLKPPEGELGDPESPGKNEPAKPQGKMEAPKTQDKAEVPEPPAKIERPDTDNKEEMPETQEDAVPLEDTNDKPDVVNTIPVNDSTFEDVDGESYFFSYFMVICVLFVLGYVGYHNRQKVIALVLEGKQGKRRYRGRRPNSANYHKLDSNLEEAISSSYTKSTSHIIY